MTLTLVQRPRDRLLIMAAWAITLGMAAPSSAQIAAPARPAPAVPQGSPLDRELPLTTTPTAPALPLMPESSSAPFAPDRVAQVTSVTVDGATVITPTELSALTAGLTGPAVPLNQIEQVRINLVARYRQSGYLLTTVSTVLDRRGNLRFDVIEGYIADVRLDGDIGPAGTQVLRFLQKITRERPVRISTIERYLLLATDVPGVTLRSVLRPSSDDPAAITLIAQVSRKPVDGLVAADNRSFRLAGPEQALAVAGFNSFSQFGERTELSILHSFNNTETFGQAASEFFVGGSGLKIRLYGGSGSTTPSGSLRELGYQGVTRIFGAQFSYPVIRSRQQTLSAIGTFDAVESDIRELGPNNTETRNSFDSLRILRVGADYAMQDQIFGGERTGVNSISFRLSHGLRTLGATREDDPQTGRVDSNPDFFKFSAEISRRQTLFQLSADSSVALYGLLAGQVSSNVLPPEETFALGGLRTNRGFYAGEVTGDNALTTTAELQYTTIQQVTAFGQTVDMNMQYYIFHDWGEAWQNQAQYANKHLESFGGGIRSQVTPHLGIEIEGVSRLTRNPDGAAGTVSALKADAVYWRLVMRF